MGINSKSNYCDPCIVACDGKGALVININRVFRNIDKEPTTIYQWFADYQPTDKDPIEELTCDKELLGCGLEALQQAVIGLLNGKFDEWLQNQLGGPTTNKRFVPDFVKGICSPPSSSAESYSCNPNISVRVEGGFSAIIQVRKQPLCEPCNVEIAPIPPPLTIKIGPYQ